MASAKANHGGIYEKLSSRDIESSSSSETESDISSDIEASARFQRQSRWPLRRTVLVWTISQILLLTVYTGFLVKVLGLRSSAKCIVPPRPEDVIYSPAAEAIQWESKMLDTRLRQQNAYVGEPSDKIDAAWAELLSLSNIAIPASAVQRALNKTSIPIPFDPSKVWATLGVNHELHCLKRLRMAVYSDHYYPSMTSEERRLNQMHSGHCVDYLRQMAMCRGDVSLTTYHWDDALRLPVADFNASHACVNWDRLKKWQRERVVDVQRPGWLVHPKFGPAFPNGTGDGLGVLPTSHFSDAEA